MTRYLLLAFTVVAFAADLPKPTGFVNDFAGKLTSVDRQVLEDKLREHEHATTNEIAVAIVKSLDGQPVEEYANRLFKAWGIGKKERNNGVLLLWAPVERKIRIEVGLGLEQEIPNETAAAILRDVTAAFRREDYVGGLNAGVDGIIARLSQPDASADTPIPETEAPVESGSGVKQFLTAAGVVAGVAVLIVIVWRRGRKRYLEASVPKDLDRAATAMGEAERIRLDATVALEELRREAPQDLWENFETLLAKAPATLADLQVELNRIRSLPQGDYGELSLAHRELKLWNGPFSDLWENLSAVRKRLDSYRDCRERAPLLMNELRESLSRSESQRGWGQSAKLIDAAAATWSRAVALAAINPVNWLLVYDLLRDAEDCLHCANDASGYRRRDRMWVAGEMDSPAYEVLSARVAAASASSGSSSWSGDSGNSSSAGDSGGFGGGDCGGGGASSDY